MLQKFKWKEHRFFSLTYHKMLKEVRPESIANKSRFSIDLSKIMGEIGAEIQAAGNKYNGPLSRASPFYILKE
jgi:hypothetical protein